MAPDTCAGILLPANATSILVPKGTLASGQTYTALLSFMHLNDSGKTMPSTTAQGFAAVTRQTQMPIRTTGGLPSAPPPFIRSITLVSGGKLNLLIETATDRSLAIEQSPGLGQPFITLLTTNPPVSPVQVTLTRPGFSPAFYRASHP